MALNKNTWTKFEDLQRILSEMGGVLVAFSGGVDSTLLAYAAKQILGEKALAVTGRSVTIAQSELEESVQLARHIGIRHLILDTKEIEIEMFGNNPPNRCYYCKNELYFKLLALAGQEKIPFIVDGSNSDDKGEHRPGIQAARELGVRSPLMEANLNKQEIRALSKQFFLPNWDKPAMACLSSRFPYGDEITEEKIRQVEKAEAFLHSIGFRQLRVRHHGTIARLEISLDEMASLLDGELSVQVVRGVKDAGFSYVTLDLEGFRSGSMNEVLENQRYLPLVPHQ